MNQNTASAVAPQPDKARPAANKWKSEPSQIEVILLFLFSGAVFIAGVSLFRPFVATLKSFGDYDSMVLFATAIRHWDFNVLPHAKLFWGMPYTIALLSLLTRLPEMISMLIISYVSGLATAFYARRLWGGVVAGFFLALNFGWMQRTFLGGTEPYFMALICAGFWAARKDRWYLAALLAALATSVRPVGIFALAGIGLALLIRKDYKRFAIATAIGLLIGICYVVPVKMVYGTAAANVQSYQSGDWAGGRLLTWPFVSIVKSTMEGGVPWTNLMLTMLWVSIVTLGLVAILASSRMREFWRSYPAEMIFAVLYILFLFTYNSPKWARAEFVRFCVPALPLVFVALRRWLPTDRRILWGLTAGCSFLAACSAVGIRNAFAVIHGLLR